MVYNMHGKAALSTQSPENRKERRHGEEQIDS